LTEAFALYQWTVAIRGVEGGGLVQGLPTHTFKTDEGDVALKCPTEIAITDRREKEFSDLGFIPLVHCKGTDYAAFFAAQSAQKAKKYDQDFANANARLSTQLPYIFAVSRFAHYLKAIMRDKIGSFMSRMDVERYLNQWISNYVTPDDNRLADREGPVPAARRARGGRGHPGQARRVQGGCVPADHTSSSTSLQVSLRLVTELPKPAAADRGDPDAAGGRAFPPGATETGEPSPPERSGTARGRRKIGGPGPIACHESTTRSASRLRCSTG
jgi:type VI secretion system protein ImpC